MNDALKRKISLSTKEELTKMLLKDTDMKFAKLILLWSSENLSDRLSGNAVAGKLVDNLSELKYTLNTELGDENTRTALKNIYNLYVFLIDEISKTVSKNDYLKVKECHEIYKIILEILNK